MKVLEAMGEVLSRSGISRAQLAEAMGVSRPAVTNALAARGITADKVSRWCRAMGYDLVLVPSQQVRFLHESCIVIDPYGEES